MICLFKHIGVVPEVTVRFGKSHYTVCHILMHWHRHHPVITLSFTIDPNHVLLVTIFSIEPVHELALFFFSPKWHTITHTHTALNQTFVAVGIISSCSLSHGVTFSLQDCSLFG